MARTKATPRQPQRRDHAPEAPLQNPAHEFKGLLLLAAGLVLFLSLISYTPQDVPGWFPLRANTARPSPHTLNFLGTLGAMVAVVTYTALGSAAYLLCAMLLGYGSAKLILPGAALSRRALWSVSFVLSAKVLDPQFQGQIKERLNSRDAVRLVSGFVRPALELWLNQHVDYGKKLAELAIKAAQTRQRAGQKVEKRKSSGVAVLPGKLTDCESRDLAYNEVFLVEGDSAGGSAKMGRDKENQAILPLRGKVLNTWEVDRDRLFANTEIHDISVAIGVDPHGPDDTPDLSGLRYGKVCILSDADVDGSHIQVLLLTLFFRHFPKLIEAGHVYVARPPLFRVDAPARGKKPASKAYALDAGEMGAILDKLRKEGVREGAWSISRFKGLGEMNAEQLWDTTLNPDTRRLLPVALGAIDFAATESLITKLMGKGEAAARRELMELHGDSVEIDV